MPDYSSSTNTSVKLRLNSAELDESYIKMIISEEERLQSKMPVDARIVLSVLKTERRATIALLSSKIQKPVSDTRPVVEWLIEFGMVEGVGNGSAGGVYPALKCIPSPTTELDIPASAAGIRCRSEN